MECGNTEEVTDIDTLRVVLILILQVVPLLRLFLLFIMIVVVSLEGFFLISFSCLIV